MDEGVYTKEEVIVNNLGIVTAAIILQIISIAMFFVAIHSPILGSVLYFGSLFAFVYYADTRIKEGAAFLIFLITILLFFLVDRYIQDIPAFDTFIAAFF